MHSSKCGNIAYSRKARRQILIFERDTFKSAIEGMWHNPDIKRDVNDFVKRAVAAKELKEKSLTNEARMRGRGLPRGRERVGTGLREAL